MHPAATRIEQLPPIILVFGGALGDAKKSARQMFINWLMIKRPAVSKQIRTPEQYEDWNSFEGYSNLVDFEIDAGNLTKVIVLFSESAGSCAELGSFCMDKALSERLFVVVSNADYLAPSFIANGPIKKIELEHENSVCVLNTLDPLAIQEELPSLMVALDEKLASFPRTQIFVPSRDRDQFLLAADLIDLFGAITLHELRDLMRFMQAEVELKKVERIVSQLSRFGLVERVAGTTKRYLIAPRERVHCLNYSGMEGMPAFERAKFKILKAMPWLTGDAPRLDAYNKIHARA